MKIKGTKVYSEQVEVRVSYYDVINSLCEELLNRLKPKEISVHDQMYINLEGEWEGWDNGRGSGDYYHYRAATQEEKDALRILNEFNSFARKTLKED